MIDGYKQEKDSLVRQEWFIIRRVMFAAAAFFALEHIWLSFSVIFLCTLLTIIANFQKPFSSKLSYMVNQINELFLLSFQYHLFSFTNFVELAETRVLMGYSLTLVTLLNILINLLINLAVTGVALKLWIKTHYLKLKKKCSK